MSGKGIIALGIGDAFMICGGSFTIVGGIAYVFSPIQPYISIMNGGLMSIIIGVLLKFYGKKKKEEEKEG